MAKHCRRLIGLLHKTQGDSLFSEFLVFDHEFRVEKVSLEWSVQGLHNKIQFIAKQ
jgi:hypothetical protein